MNPRLKRRRGVASIVGGLFIVLIIISAYAFFMMSNKATSDLQSTINNQSSRDEAKSQENLSLNYIVLNPDSNGVVLAVVNSGSKTVTINYIGIDDISINGDYSFYEPIGNPNINSGDISSFNIPISSQIDIYRIKLITSKGNVFSFDYPSVITLINSPPSISITPAIKDGQQCYILSGSYFAQSASSITIDITSGVNSFPYPPIPAPDGYFSVYLNQLPYDIYTVKARDSASGSSTATLFVTPYIVLTPNQSPYPPDHVSIKGSGYPKAKTIKFLFDNLDQATTPAQIVTDSSSGAFTADLDVTGKSAGNHIIVAEYFGDNSEFLWASNIFTVS